MMAFDSLEPEGSLVTMHAFGQVCATIANVHRGKDTEPYRPEMFFPALAREVGPTGAGGPVLLKDKNAQSALIRGMLGKHSAS